MIRTTPFHSYLERWTAGFTNSALALPLIQHDRWEIVARVIAQSGSNCGNRVGLSLLAIESNDRVRNAHEMSSCAVQTPCCSALVLHGLVFNTTLEVSSTIARAPPRAHLT